MERCRVIADTQSALDLVMTVKYETGAERIGIDKDVVCGDFFFVSTKEEAVQKLTEIQ